MKSLTPTSVALALFIVLNLSVKLYSPVYAATAPTYREAVDSSSPQGQIPPFAALLDSQYSDTQFGFSLNYPKGWTVEPGLFTDSDDQMWVTRLIASYVPYFAVNVTLLHNPRGLGLEELIYTGGAGWDVCTGCSRPQGAEPMPLRVGRYDAYRLVGFPLSNSEIIAFARGNVAIMLESVGAADGMPLYDYGSDTYLQMQSVLTGVAESLQFKGELLFRDPSGAYQATEVPPIADALAEPVSSGSPVQFGVKNPGAWFCLNGQPCTHYSSCYGLAAKDLYHAGTDYVDLKTSSPILAIGDGVVKQILGWSPGTSVVVEHTLIDGRKVYSHYAHLNENKVHLNQVVKRGDLVGYPVQQDGNTHLHFEIRTWETTDFKCPVTKVARTNGTGYSDQDPTSQGYYDPMAFIKKLSAFDGVVLYEHANYQGAQLHLTSNDLDLCDNPLDPALGTIECFTAPSWTNNASSIRVAPGWRARLHKHNQADADKWGDDESQALNCNQDIPDFRTMTFPDGLTLDNEVSRIYVFKCLAAGSNTLTAAGTQSSACDPASPPSANWDGAEFRSVETNRNGAGLAVTWTVHNAGTTSWGQGYTLAFRHGEQMGAPDSVAVPSTPPGGDARITVGFTLPSQPGIYTSYWVLRAPNGVYFGPELSGTGTVDKPNAPPPADKPAILTCLNCLATMAPGQSYRPTMRITIGEGQLLPDRGDMLRNTDGNRYGAWEHVAVDRVVGPGQSIDLTFYENNPLRAPDSPGVYESKWRIWRDGGWYGPELTIRFEVKSGGGNRAPYPPTLTSPHDWAVYTGNGGIVLSAQQNGDPDGNPITHYYFEISGQQTANSGWITSSSWSPQGLGYYGYQWHVKVRDSQGIESGWSSQTWNFSVQTNEPQIYEFYATQCRAAWDNGNTEKLCFCARTNAGTIKLQVNSATDGSDRGEWEVINELGSSSWSCSSDSDHPPTWDHLRYESGRHLVRLYARRDGGWAAAANRDIYVDLSTARRPNSPSVTLPQWESYVNSRTVLIDWRDTLRTSSYRLQVATDPGLANLVLDTTVSASVSQYQYTFAADYPNLYGRVTAVGPYGTNTADLRFQIDRTPPQSAVSALPSSVYDTQFGVQWGGSDGQSGLNWYHVQVRDGSRADSTWVDWLVNTTRTAEIFTGLPGHTYFFRVRAMDNITNWEDWPANADASTTIDPAARPPETWWNTGYQQRRSITVLNGMGSRELPVGYPLHLRLDGSTTPTAQAIYDGLLAGTPCTDLRVIYNNSSELLRYIPMCSRDQIDIWFQNQAALGANASDGVSYRLYYGNAAAGSVQNDATQVLPPVRDANTKGLWYFSEGAGSTFADSSGNNNTGSLRGLVWGEGLFGGGLVSQEHAAGNGAMVPGSASLSSSVFTLEFYARRADNDNTTIMGQGQAGNDRERVRLWIEGGGRIKYQVDPAPGGASDIWANSGCLPDLAWHHVAITFDGYRTGTIFCDSVQMTSALFNEVGIGAYNFDLFFGSDFTDATRFKGWIDQVRLSNIVRTSFPHGTFAMITTPPSVAAGDFVPAPLTGDSNLAVESLRLYDRTGGGYIAEAVVRNLGTKSTQSGFYTDLYIDHVPTGPGDYSGSVQFWVNSPIAAGAVVTLTAPLPAITAAVAAQEPGAAPNDASAAGAAPAEVTRTLYVQTDSTGAVRESDRSNNVTAGYEVCTAAADGFEPDDSAAAAKTLVLGTPQTHNFSSAADGDWLRFRTTAGITYTFSTGDLGLAADTYLHLYSPDRSMLLDSNDDSAGSLASSITWKAPAGDDYYLLVRSWNPNVQGCGTSYTVRVGLTSSLAPTSAFTAGSRQGVAPFAVQFTDQSQGQVTAWQWTFGDDQTSTEQHPIHTYQLPGTYTVGLTVNGPGGTHSRSEPGYIVVNARIDEPLPNHIYLPGIVK